MTTQKIVLTIELQSDSYNDKQMALLASTLHKKVGGFLSKSIGETKTPIGNPMDPKLIKAGAAISLNKV